MTRFALSRPHRLNLLSALTATGALTYSSPPPPAPAPPAAPSGAILLRPLTTWSGSKAWTQGLLLPYGAIPSGDTIGNAAGTIQVDVRNRYSDGSLRFAVLSGITTAADITLLRNADPASGGTVAEPSVSAVVALSSVVNASGSSVAGGSFSADIATARSAGITAWDRSTARKVRQILGPVMSEFHYYVPTSDAHTHVWFYVRAYSDGAIEVETVVENGWLNLANPGQRTYNVTVTINGTERYSGVSIAHYHHTRWSRVDWAGTDPAAIMAQSTSHLQTTGIVPKIGVSSLAASAYTARPENGTKHSAWTASAANQPAPFAIANMDPSMGAGGDTDMYGMVPEWAATYLVEGNIGAYYACIANARAVGRYGLHYRDEDDGRPVRGSVETTITINGTASGMSPNYTGGTTTPAPSGSAPPSWTYSHSPAAAFAGAILTGRWSFIEQTQFQAATTDLCFNSNTHAGFRIPEWYDQNRVIAWMLRDRVHAEALTPSEFGGSVLSSGDDYNQRLEAVGRLEAVADEWTDLYVSGSGTGKETSARASALGVPWQLADFEIQGNRQTDGVHGYGGLQNGFYVACALYAFNARPALDSTALTQWDGIAAQLGKYATGLLGAHSGATRDWRVCTHVTIPVGTPGGDLGDADADAATYYASWDVAYTELQSFGSWASGTWPLTADSDNYIRKVSLNGSYELRLEVKSTFTADTDIIAFGWAVQQMHEAAGRVSITGADLAASRWYGSDTWAHGVADLFRERPGLALESSRLPPVWQPAAGELVNLRTAGYLTNTFMSQAPSPSPGGNGGFKEVVDAFSGGVYNPNFTPAGAEYGAMVLHGGGHENSYDNSTTVLKIGDTLTFERLDNPTSPMTIGTEAWCEHADGRPYSAHTADCLGILPPADGGGQYGSLVRVMSQATGSAQWRNPLGGAGDTLDTTRAHKFDMSTETWSRYTAASGFPGSSPQNYACNAYDSDLQRFWFISGVGASNNPDLFWLTHDGTYGSQACLCPTFETDTPLMRLVETGGKRLLILGGVSPSSSVVKIGYLDITNTGSIAANWSVATLSASIAATYSFSFDWCPDNSRLIVFSGSTTTGVHEIEIPATLSNNWTVTSRPFVGGTIPNPGVVIAKRWSYIPAIKCFVFLPRAFTGVDPNACDVYAYRPHGT